MIGKLTTVAFDAADNRGLARFYSDLLGGPITDDEGGEWLEVTTPDGWGLGFQRAPDHRAPEWPGQEHPQQMHIDFQVADREAMTAKAESLGAKRIGGGETWNVLADPAGHPFCLASNEQDEPIRVFAVNLDCPDAPELARFYRELLGMDLKYEGNEGAGMAWIGIDGPNGNILFQGVSDYSAPQWPDPAHPQQMHLDIHVDDVEAAEEAALKLGATRLADSGDGWRVYADPAGHPFCFCH